MKERDILTVTIEAFDHQGRGIAHLDGYTIFVFDALVNETVEIKILKVRKKIIEAESVKIIKASEKRVVSPCPYFRECGGCDLLHISYENQLKYKENKVREILKKFAGLEDKVTPIVPSQDVFGYRNKAMFQVQQKIGFYQKKSNQVIEVEKCLLLSNNMNQILSIMKENVDLKYINQIMIRSNLNGDILVLFDVLKGFQKKQIVLDKWNGISLIIKCGDNYEIVSGTDFLMEEIGEYRFKVSKNSFFQVNGKQIAHLYQCVLSNSNLSGKEKVLDLYCGTGTIGIFLSKYAKEVLGIEIVENAVKDAIENKKQNNLSNVDFVCGDVGTVLKKSSFFPDLVIVDPPRSGLFSNALLEIQKINAPKIIYVSCNPVTLARDVKTLSNQYEVETITPVDMFPNTYHVECVCVLNRRL